MKKKNENCDMKHECNGAYPPSVCRINRRDKGMPNSLSRVITGRLDIQAGAHCLKLRLQY